MNNRFRLGNDLVRNNAEWWHWHLANDLLSWHRSRDRGNDLTHIGQLRKKFASRRPMPLSLASSVRVGERTRLNRRSIRRSRRPQTPNETPGRSSVFSPNQNRARGSSAALVYFRHRFI